MSPTKPSALADAIGHIAWITQSTHQAHHDERGDWTTCPRGLCRSSVYAVEKLKAALSAEMSGVQSTSHATVEQLVTATKARGCALALRGETKPEGWPFAVLLAISKPGGEAAVELVEQAAARLSELTTVEVAT